MDIIQRDIEQRFIELSNRLSRIETQLKYEVIKVEGPFVIQMNELVETVGRMQREAATKNEIEKALDQQTQQLSQVRNHIFTRSTKAIATATGLIVIGLQIYQSIKL